VLVCTLAAVRSGFWVSGLEFRFSGFGFRCSGLGVRVSSFGHRVSGFRFRVSRFGFRVSGLGSRDSGFGSRVAGLGFRGLGESLAAVRVPRDTPEQEMCCFFIRSRVSFPKQSFTQLVAVWELLVGV